MSKLEEIKNTLNSAANRYKKMTHPFKPVSADEIFVLATPIISNGLRFAAISGGYLMMMALKYYKYREMLEVLEIYDLAETEISKITSCSYKQNLNCFTTGNAKFAQIANLTDAFLKSQQTDWRMRSFYHPNNYGNSYHPHVAGSQSHSLTVRANGCNFYSEHGFGVHMSYFYNDRDYTRRWYGKKKWYDVQRNHFSAYVLRPFDAYGNSIYTTRKVVKDVDCRPGDIYSLKIGEGGYLVSNSPIKFLGLSWFNDRFVSIDSNFVTEIKNSSDTYLYMINKIDDCYLYFKPLMDNRVITLSYFNKRKDNNE